MGTSNAKESAIEVALRRIDGVNQFLSKKEIKELPRILWEDELPEALVTGHYITHTGILVATANRVIFIDKGWLTLTVEDFPYDKISSIEYHVGMMAGEIDIYASGNKSEIKWVPKDQVRPFAEGLRARISRQEPSQTESTKGTPAPSQPDELERLANLKAQGMLTDAEFELAKKRVLEAA